MVQVPDLQQENYNSYSRQTFIRNVTYQMHNTLSP